MTWGDVYACLVYVFFCVSVYVYEYARTSMHVRVNISSIQVYVCVNAGFTLSICVGDAGDNLFLGDEWHLEGRAPAE